MSLENLIVIIPIASLAGFLAGLLGIGGGLLTVPAILYLLKADFSPLQHLQQIALGTSFAVMVLTVASSARAHHNNGNIEWSIVKKMLLPLICGCAAGALISPYIPGKYLQILFILFTYFTAVKSAINLEKKTATDRPLNPVIIQLVGFTTGLLSSWIGIGGGVIFVPLLLYQGISIQKSLGTSATLTFPTALVSALSYLLVGLSYTDVLPKHSIGFIYLPYFLAFALCTTIFAPLGAKLGSRSPQKLLKALFFLLLLTIASKMSWDLVRSWLFGIA